MIPGCSLSCFKNISNPRCGLGDRISVQQAHFGPVATDNSIYMEPPSGHRHTSSLYFGNEVPECIYKLAQAGINIWVVTGDKMEIAINIGCFPVTQLFAETGDSWFNCQKDAGMSSRFQGRLLVLHLGYAQAVTDE
ncbi:putative phospholipid-transporting ATPase 9 [Tanacetum coccineum]